MCLAIAMPTVPLIGLCYLAQYRILSNRWSLDTDSRITPCGVTLCNANHTPTHGLYPYIPTATISTV